MRKLKFYTITLISILSAIQCAGQNNQTDTDPFQYTAIAEQFISQRDFGTADKYITVARIYTTYDLYRVTDPSATKEGNMQAAIWQSIEPWVITHPTEVRSNLKNAIEFTEKNPPTHEPQWLLKNSIARMMGDSPTAPKEQWPQLWEKTLTKFKAIAENDSYWDIAADTVKNKPALILKNYIKKISPPGNLELQEKLQAVTKAFEESERTTENLEKSIQTAKYFKRTWQLNTKNGSPEVNPDGPKNPPKMDSFSKTHPVKNTRDSLQDSDPSSQKKKPSTTLKNSQNE